MPEASLNSAAESDVKRIPPSANASSPNVCSRQSIADDDGDVEQHGSAGSTSGQEGLRSTSSDAMESRKKTEAGMGSVEAPVDIEHELVEDDPRSWSPGFKWALVAILCAGALIPTMGANIFFPAINDVKADLNASDGQIALSISLFILAQGAFPLLWSPLSEIIGRKKCFLAAMGIFTVCMAIIGGATVNIAMLIAFRVIGAAGSAALLAISAGTLADLYEPAERGVKVGIYYCSPLLGPAFAPILGGLLTDAGASPGEPGIAGWRLTFIFLAACGAVSFISYIFFRETFRVERSLAWQKAKQQALQRAEAGNTEKTQRAEAGNTEKTQRAEAGNTEKTQSLSSRLIDYIRGLLQRRKNADTEEGTRSRPTYKSAASDLGGSDLTRRITTRASLNRTVLVNGEQVKFRPTLSDVSPLRSAVAVCKQPHNIIALLYSGLAFASQYSLTYTATRTFTAPPYSYGPIYIGLILLSLGGGGMIGSILGGRLSDRALRRGSERLSAAAGHGSTIRAPAELRILSVRLPMLLCPPCFVGYAWAADYKTHIAIPIVILFFLGFSLFWIYASTLSYIVDSNTGRSTGAVACNSAIRGLFAFAASEAAGRIQDSVGDGPLYTGWAVLLAIGQVGLLIVGIRGERWRHPDWSWRATYRRSKSRM